MPFHLSAVRIRPLAVATVFLVSLLALVAAPKGAVRADGSTLLYATTGCFDVASYGVGLFGDGAGSVDVSVPGPVEKVFIEWVGVEDDTPPGDGTSELVINGVPVAGTLFPPPADQTELGGDNHWYAWYADIGPGGYNLITGPGVTTLNISGWDSSSPKTNGATVTVIYSTGDCATPNQITVYGGVDWYYFGTTGHEFTELLVYTFDPSPADRVATIWLSHAGTDSTQTSCRGGAIWMAAGSGSPPPPDQDLVARGSGGRGYGINGGVEIVNDPFTSPSLPCTPSLNPTPDEPYEPGHPYPGGAATAPYRAVNLDPPGGGDVGPEWGIVAIQVVIPAHSTWAAFQLESEADQNGESGSWAGSGVFSLPRPRVTVVKEVAPPVAGVGEMVTYTYTVANTGNQNLSNLTAVDDRLGQVPLPVTTLAVGQQTVATLTYTVQAGDLPGPLINTVVVTGTTPDNTQVTDSAQARLALKALALEKTVSPSTAAEGQTVTYTYTITNTGSITLTHLILEDDRLGNIPLFTGRVESGLQVLYPFDETGGAVVHDRSGVGTPLDLTIQDPGNVSWLNGALRVSASTLISSNGPGSKIYDACTAANELTVEAWIQPANDTQAGPARIVTLSTNPNLRNFTLGQDGNIYVQRLRTTVTNLNGTSHPVLGGTVDPGRISHVLFTRDASGVARLYVDGIEVASRTDLTGDFSNWDATYPFALANELTGDRPWLGDLHLVAVYCRALNAGEVGQNYAAGPHGTLLAPGSSLTVTRTYTIQAGDLPGPLVNTATARGYPPVGDPVSAQDSAQVALIVPTPNVAVVKRLNTPEPVRLGEPISFTVQITNTGNVTLTTVPLTDTYHVDYMTFVGSSLAPVDNVNDGTINWTDLTGPVPYGVGQDLAPGQSIQVVVEFVGRADTTGLEQAPCDSPGPPVSSATCNVATADGLFYDPDGPGGQDPRPANLGPRSAHDDVQIFAPTAVDVADLSLRVEGAAVEVTWRSLDERNILAFRVERVRAGEAEPTLVARVLARSGGQAQGHVYQVRDTDPPVHQVLSYSLVIEHLDGTWSRRPLGQVVVGPRIFLPAVSR